MSRFQPLTEADERQAWYEQMAQECDCCERCSDAPCAGVLQGGVCDRMCSCGGLDPEYEWIDPEDDIDR